MVASAQRLTRSTREFGGMELALTRAWRRLTIALDRLEREPGAEGQASWNEVDEAIERLTASSGAARDVFRAYRQAYFENPTL